MGLFVRIGNFVNSEIIGTRTENVFGVLFSNNIVNEIKINYNIKFVKLNKIDNILVNKRTYQPILIDILFDNDNFSDKSIKDEIINILVEKKWIILETVEDYDDLDLLFETLNETYKSFININFNLRYNYLLNFSISEIQNLYYSGDTFDFVLNLDLFCK